MIAAVNDIFLGPESVIDVRGANGHSGGGGGGGGGRCVSAASQLPWSPHCLGIYGPLGC